MVRKWMFTRVSILAATVMLVGTPANANAWFGCDVNSPYVPGCRSGHCPGGDYYVGGRLRGAWRWGTRHNVSYGTANSTVYGSSTTYPMNGSPTLTTPTPSPAQP